jgi:hypothetical protein
MLRFSWSWLGPTLVVALALTGCSVLDRASTEPDEPASGKPAREAPKGPVDRDLNEVVGALLAIDPCKLIDPSVAASVHFASVRDYVRTAPHACVGSHRFLVDDRVKVTLGDSHRHLHRYRDMPVTVSGARAYRFESTLSSKTCEVNIPVSFERSIQVSTEGGLDSRLDVCAAAEAFTAAVVRLLADPSKVAVDPADSPYARWSACLLLGAALGPEADKWELEMDENIPALDGCAADQKGEGTNKSTIDLEVSHDTDPTRSSVGTNKRVGDKTANVDERSGTCTVRYSPGESRAGSRLYGVAVVILRAPTCVQAEQVTVATQKALAGNPPTLKARSGPLTYRPDEPDSGARGACVDFNANGDWAGCEPVPNGTKPPSGDVLAAVADDPQAMCATAAGSVRTLLGDAYKPVRWGEFCVFVEPTHHLTVWLDASTRYSPSEYGANRELYRDKRTIDIAGHPAISFTTGNAKTSPEYHVYASTGSDLAAKGFVNVQFSYLGPRGRSEAAPKVTGLDKLSELLTELMTPHVR